MELNIGANIKRLRLARGLTQEQLADLLCVSAAAVSKWEAKNTYPDITMLFPLAGIFGISIDALLGYDEAQVQHEIDSLLAEYNELGRSGHANEASILIANARKRYPHDHRIMHTYMWDKAGGSAANQAEILLEHQDEFMQICRCILDNCTSEPLRLEALNMQAKLLHAQGNTSDALELLSQIPGMWSCAEQKKEQLFAKDSAEYRALNRENCYKSMDAMAIKLARSVRFDNLLSEEEKQRRLESMGSELDRLCHVPALACFCLAAQTMYTELASMLSAEGSPADISDIIRIREKQFTAMKATMAHARNDESLHAFITRKYRAENMLLWQIQWLLDAEQPRLARLREYPAYMDMLLKQKAQL